VGLVGTTRSILIPEVNEVKMAWIFLILAGLLEIAWASTIKAAAHTPSIVLISATAVLLATSMATLGLSMRMLPLGVAYPIWTGIGSVGSVIVSVLIYKQPLEFQTIAGLICLIIGMILIGGNSH